MPTTAGPSAGTSLRWPWLLVGVLGLAASIGLLIPSLPHRRERAVAHRPPPFAAGPPPMQPAAPPPPPPSIQPSQPSQGAEPVAQGPVGPPPEPAKKPHRPTAPNKTGRPPTSAPPKPAVKRFAEGAEDDMMPESASPTAAAPKIGKKQKQAHRESAPKTHDTDSRAGDKPEEAESAAQPDHDEGSAGHGPGRGEKPAGIGSIGAGGHAGRQSDDESQSLTRLLRGHFEAKFPRQMRLNASSRVRAVVTDKANAAEAQATLEAAPVGGGRVPAQVLAADILIGKLLRMELRALSSEFEIMPITPTEQRVLAGQVTQWEWVVVPRSEGPHQLSLIVTNLTDYNGHPLGLTIHEAEVEVEVSTMEKIRAVAGLISSGISGLAGLFGAWMGVLRPLLQRRREERDDRDGGRPTPTSGGGSAPKPGPAPSGDAATPPPAAASSTGEAAKPIASASAETSGAATPPAKPTV